MKLYELMRKKLLKKDPFISQKDLRLDMTKNVFLNKWVENGIPSNFVKHLTEIKL